MNLIEKEDPKELKTLERVFNDYSWAREYRRNYEEDWLRYYRMYKSFIDENEYPFESRLFVPYSFAVIEAQIPMMIQAIFGSSSFIEVNGRNLDSEGFASMVKDILAYQFERNINPYKLSHAWLKQSLIYGTSPAFADWMYKSDKVKVKVPRHRINGNVIDYIIKEFTRTIVNGPVANVIDIFRYFQCPDTPQSPADGISGTQVLFAGYEFQTTYEELLADAKNGIYNYKDVKKLKNMKTNSDLGESKLLVLNKQSSKETKYKARNILDGIHYFGKIVNDRDELVYKLITIIFPGGLVSQGDNRNGVIVREVENPLNISRIPISLLRVNPVEGELYGIGDLQTIESLQIELNDQRNQRCDIVVRSMNPMWKTKSGNNIDETMLQYRAHGVIELDDVNDLVELRQTPTSIKDSLTEESIIKQDIQFATGVSDFIAGTYQNTTGFNDTATGISLIQNAAAGRMTIKTQFTQLAIKELAELIWSMDVLHIPMDTIIKVLDPFSASKFRFLRVTPEITAGQYDFSVVNAASMGNPQIRRQQFIQLLDALSKVIPAASQAGQTIQLNYQQLIHRLLKEYEIRNLSEILPALANSQTINNIPEILNATLDDGESLDPEVEHSILAEGIKDLPVHVGDDDLVHAVSHANELSNPRPGIDIVELQKHLSLTIEQIERKKRMLLDTNQLAGVSSNGTVAPELESALNGLDAVSSPDAATQLQEQLIRDSGNANSPANRS